MIGSRSLPSLLVLVVLALTLLAPASARAQDAEPETPDAAADAEPAEDASPEVPNEEKLLGAVWAILATISYIGASLSVLAALLLLSAVAPQRSAALADALETHPWLTIGLGSANLFGLLILTGIFGALQLVIFSLPLFCILCGFVLAGWHASAGLIGRRLTAGSERRWSSPAQVALGWFVIAFFGPIPVVGWIAAFWWTVRGAGAAVVVLVTSIPGLSDASAPARAS